MKESDPRYQERERQYKAKRQFLKKVGVAAMEYEIETGVIVESVHRTNNDPPGGVESPYNWKVKVHV